jgi:uncharacterized protein YqjF (DUF2071 family)
MAFAFLSARWTNLALITYAFDPRVLDPILPPGCVADTVDGRAFASLVAFDFLDTRVLGVRWPGFVHFPEINLRYYVRGPDGRRGVAFVGELVPQRLVAWMARTLYNEPYRAVPMTSRVEEDERTITMRHAATIGGREQTLHVVGAKPSHVPATDSVEHFFKEHEWGFGTRRGGRLVTYRVVHDVWAVYPVASHELNLDVGLAYGERWAFLDDATPRHVALAAGGPVKVYPWRGDVAAPTPPSA